jgi:hypothetical protein
MKPLRDEITLKVIIKPTPEHPNALHYHKLSDPLVYLIVPTPHILAIAITPKPKIPKKETNHHISNFQPTTASHFQFPTHYRITT